MSSEATFTSPLLKQMERETLEQLEKDMVQELQQITEEAHRHSFYEGAEYIMECLREAGMDSEDTAMRKVERFMGKQLALWVEGKYTFNAPPPIFR
jgi:hypothetical protein